MLLQTIPLRLSRSAERLPDVRKAIHRNSPLGIMCLAAVRRCFCRLDADSNIEQEEDDDDDEEEDDKDKRCGSCYVRGDC